MKNNWVKIQSNDISKTSQRIDIIYNCTHMVQSEEKTCYCTYKNNSLFFYANHMQLGNRRK